MGFNFRKSFSVGPFKTTISKSGLSFSAGVKGARITKSTSGRTTKTLSIPGTGIYHTQTTSNKKKKNNNIKSNKVEKPQKEEYNMFDKFNLTDKESELFSFIFEHQDELKDSFTIHDVSALGYVSPNSCYTNLYNKGLFIKPSRGKYNLNFELLNKLALEKEEKIKKEEELKAIQQLEYNEKIRKANELRAIQALKNKKRIKLVCKICCYIFSIFSSYYLLVFNIPAMLICVGAGYFLGMKGFKEGEE